MRASERRRSSKNHLSGRQKTSPCQCVAWKPDWILSCLYLFLYLSTYIYKDIYLYISTNLTYNIDGLEYDLKENVSYLTKQMANIKWVTFEGK